MNVLYVCHRIPYPPDKGEKIRAHHYIRHLAARHAVHVGCLFEDRIETAHGEALRRMCASVEAIRRGKAARRVAELTALVDGRSLSVSSFYSRELARVLERRIRAGGIDVVVVQSGAMAEYVRRLGNVPRVMDFVDLDSEKWRVYAKLRPFPWSGLFRLEAKRLARYEDEVARTFELSVFISSAEADLLARRVPGARVEVIPNGVDLEYYAPGAVSDPGPFRNAMVFTGVMDYFPNVDAMTHFCRAILPLIRREIPDAELFVVGRSPSAAVRRLAKIPGVTVTGEVHDTRPWIARAKLSVAPFRVARGVQNKVLEALAMGVPVVGTALAFQGIAARPGAGIEVADAPEAFAAEVVALLRGDSRRREQGMRARAFAERTLRWETHAGAFEKALAEVAVRRSASSAGARA